MTDTLSSNSNFFAWLEVYSKQKVSLPLNHRFIAVFAGLVLEWSNRGQMKQLLNATPEHLADIGINKSELKSALQLPLNQSVANWLIQNAAGGNRKSIT